MLDLEHDWEGVPHDGVTITSTRELFEVPTEFMVKKYHPGRSRFVIEGRADLVNRLSGVVLVEAQKLYEELGVEEKSG